MTITTNTATALFVNVTAQELRQLDIDPTQQLRLFDGGYIASLEVYHHLHCLVSLNSQSSRTMRVVVHEN